jgi:UDP-N-acetylmuramate dehydrogenase
MVGFTPFDAWLREHGTPVVEGVPLAQRTTFKIGGPVRWLVSPRDSAELGGLLRAARECDIETRVLGGGSNLLRLDGLLDSCILQLNRLASYEWTATRVLVQAGCNLPKLVKESVARGFEGLEPLTGVPGSVAGALVMNAGGKHGEIESVVRWVEVLTPEGELRRLARHEIDFRYRWSSLRGQLIVAAELELRPGDPLALKAKYDAILADKKATQPMGAPNAGCVFKNPPGGKAGRMIDACGLKGRRIGGASISEKHANFMINDGGASGDDVMRLIDLARETVRARFEVDLELEILVW